MSFPNPLEQQIKRPATVPPSLPPAFELPTNDLQTVAVVWPFSSWGKYRKKLRRFTEGEYKIVEGSLSCNYSVLNMQTSSMLILRYCDGVRSCMLKCRQVGAHACGKCEGGDQMSA